MIMAGFAVAAALAAAGAHHQPAPPPAAAAEPQWVEVGALEGYRGYVDRGSISLENGLLRFAGRILYSEPDENGVTELRHVAQIDCAGRHYRILSIDALDAAGRVIASEGAVEEPTPINPDSPNGDLHREFCR